ncbi:hypothetical protein LTR72_012320, partial [Exophiala xenobiotica]
RFTREFEKQGNDITTFTGSEEIARFEFVSGSEGKVTKLDELDKPVELILNLKETITQQTSLIEKQNDDVEIIRVDLVDVKEEQQNPTRQNAELRDQVHSHRRKSASSPRPLLPRHLGHR